MKEPKEITAFQTTAIIINSTIGISVLALPRIASEKVGSGAFLVTLIAIVLFMLIMWVVAKLSKRFPAESIVEYSQRVIGRPLGKLAGLLLICFFIVTTSLVLREFGDVMNTTLLPDTPITATLFGMLLLVAVSTRNTFSVISYMHTYYLPFIVIPLILMVVFAIQDVEMRHMKPYIGNDTTFVDFFAGGFALTGLPFFHIGFFIITVLAPYMKEPKKIVKACFWGSFISGIMILLGVGITVAVFGSEEVKASLWPMLVLTRMTELPAAILERVDVIFLVVWIISAFTTILSGYLISIELFSKLFALRSHRVMSYIIFPVVLGMSIYPKNVLQVYQLIDVIGKWGLVITAGYPLLVLIVALARGKRGVVSNEASSD
ncbi:endospore germination permease [Neobacillus sp. NPDC093182]|uniref:GerAB/ArcD/ProY family transporter n=1 Tax=Neobacillus sp. NPDC093182 TaxID=3364297 RepID=UPI00380CACC0